ncbi:Nucleoporin nup85 [Chamberlinius hualienensis]
MAAAVGGDVSVTDSNNLVVNVDDPYLKPPFQLQWRPGNNLTVYGNSPKGQIHEITWDVSMFNKHARKFVSETNSIFMSLQKLSTEKNSDVLRSLLVKISHKYRSVIKGFIDDLQLAADLTTDKVQNASFETQSQIYFKIELLWNLCEIIFIDIQPGGALLVSLLNWIRWHFPNCETLAKLVTESEDPSSHESYWDTIYSYVLQGRINEVRKFLRLHPDCKTNAFRLMDDILSKMPLFSYIHSHSSYDLIYPWKAWQEDCCRHRSLGEFLDYPPLEKLCGILCGDKEAFYELMDLCETWYHFMISHLLYTNPCVKAADLQYLAQEYIDIYGGLNSLNELDRMLLFALEFNILEVIKQSSLQFDSWWFVAHFTDLLHHAGVIQGGDGHDELPLREFLLLEYSTGLAGHSSMWQFAVDYFDHCPTRGREMLEIYLERIPLTSELSATKIVCIAEEREMHDLACSICKEMSHKSLKRNRLGSAITWALKSKDAMLVTHLADQFLNDYGKKGCFQSLALLDNLGSSMLVSDRLTFLCKYREFHQLYSQEDFQQAASILMQLLTSKFASISFWKPLLLDALPLLESDKLILNADQSFEILHFLEEWQMMEDKAMDKSQEQLLRIAIAKNLARAFTLDEQTE